MNEIIIPVMRTGECDGCHRDPEVLFIIEDDEPGDWEYCLDCIEIIVNSKKRKKEKL